MLKQGLHQKLLQKLSPQQIQFIQLLQLNATEFEKRVDEELTENPALETEAQGVTEDAKDEFTTEGTVDTDVPNNDLEINDTDIDSNDSEGNEDIGDLERDEFEENLEAYMSNDDGGDDYSYDLPNDPNEERRELPLATTSSLNENLNEQLNAISNLSENQLTLGRHLIGTLDEDGYLRRPLQSIAYDLKFLTNLDTTPEELEEVLKIIQSLDPAGIAARDLEECLTIQLERRDPEDPTIQLAKVLVDKYMDDLAKRHYDRLMKNLKIERDELKEVIDLIIHLNPKPGDTQVAGKSHYIIPDFVVNTNDDGDLHVSLTSRNAPELRVNRGFQDTLKTFQTTTQKNNQMKDQVQFIKQKLDSAKWFIEAIRQRQNTLLQTMKTIVQFQKDFFITGDIERLQPMILKDIADIIGMDISTISRVANSKYVQTDFGIYSLKEFFSEGILTESGEEVSNKEVKKILKEHIERESKDDPLTDEKLTDMLNERGYNIARRTVAKYREQMNIPVARLRKEL